ncbi:major facilitator superfamily transporter [Colletotrichum lupini]|uniref:Major facilitator superfamily transporter n=1 Tax=Colletotrichum lupini TaxID=145971 RepID=A0A9Q8SDY7_9PEZI|nr:major facilitator superfamily transporter [Colletotrichum lupini]KAK1712115.1 major facilitator superfamily transporter [Colletotrichum lupini]UQC75235.1 major facilitator superfamily transporter [Colletotrichum lupini]
MAPNQRPATGDTFSHDATETTPLLIAGDIAPTADPDVSKATTLNEPSQENETPDDDDKPLPVWQVFWLCYARLVEPMAFFCIFPYISQMAEENGHLAKADVGFYSGLIESLFSLTQAVVMIFWGRLSDRIGRKPVLVFSLCGVTIATSIFGMAQTIWQMILFRCLAGVFGGSLVTMRTMIAEHVTQKTQARAFSWFALSGNLGIFFGPLLGGALADPAHQYPSVFKAQFFFDYPYALSSFCVGFIGLTATITSILFVEETLVKEKHSSNDDAAAPPKKDKGSIKQIVKSPGASNVLFVYGYLMLLALSYTAVVPVFWFTPVELGGYGFTPLQISVMMSVNGIAQVSWLLIIFPPLQHRIGTNGVLRACAYAYPWFFLICPLGNVVLKLGVHNPAWVTFFWVFMPIALTIGCGVSMSFTAIQLSLNDISPSPRVLGTLNALALTGASVIRAFSPASFTTLFAIGANTQALGGYAIWVLMVALAAGLIFAVRNLYGPEDLKKAREQEQAESS